MQAFVHIRSRRTEQKSAVAKLFAHQNVVHTQAGSKNHGQHTQGPVLRPAKEEILRNLFDPVPGVEIPAGTSAFNSALDPFDFVQGNLCALQKQKAAARRSVTADCEILLCAGSYN